MKKTLKSFLLFLLDITGINLLFRIINRNKAIILYYHGICDDSFYLLDGYDERHIYRSSFRKHLEYLKRHGYVFVNMTTLVEALKNKTRTRKYVALTFDDGFRNIVINAYPIMNEFKAKGCFYIISDLVGKNQLVWTDYVETIIRNQSADDFNFLFKGNKISYWLKDKVSAEQAMRDIKKKLRSIPDKERREHLEQFNNQTLKDIPDEFRIVSWEEIKGLDHTILEIGSHTKGHPDCEKLVSDAELEKEILQSKLDIETQIGGKVAHFCYPAGSYNDKVVEKLREYGYESAVTTKSGFVEALADRYQLNRIAGENHLSSFKANVSGSYDYIRRIKSWFNG